MASEACLSSMVEIHKDSSSVPSYPEVLQLAFVLLIELGVKDFRDLLFGFAINVGWRWMQLDSVKDSVWS